MKILLDTNVVLDHLLDRKDFSAPAQSLFAKVEQGKILGALCATTITTTYYLIEKALNRKDASKCIRTLLKLFEIAPVNRAVIESAQVSKFKDFEDAVIHEAAINIGAQVIVTRNVIDFRPANIAVYSPFDFVNILNNLSSK